VNAHELNPIFHGEIVAINNCAKKHPQLNWSNVTMFTTAEPCPMCQSAIVWANIPRVVFASSIEHLTRSGWNQITIHAAELNSKAPFYKGSITGGVLADKTDLLFEQSKR
jgi:tRNA(Arg) A34 adenosine deaminase TadA